MADHPFRVVGARRPRTIGRACVRMRFGDLLSVLASAIDAQALWLDDLVDDEVVVTPDLAEIVRRIQLYRDPSDAA